MKIIYKPRQAGKTTELIKLASKNNYSLIVCHNRVEATRIFHCAKRIGYAIPMPITYYEFLDKGFYGKNIDSFLIDNVKKFLQYLVRTELGTSVKIEAITINKEVK